MTPNKYKTKLTLYYTLTFVFIVFTISSSFTGKETLQNIGRTELIMNLNHSITSSIAYPYFPLIYTGYGVDHMNINLVNLTSSGLTLGDEIGVFDGLFCVGSAVINEKNILDNGLSIAASANENLDANPNGYIDGHKITLKTYRSGKVFIVYYETVNNTTNIFEKGGSMFALIDFSRSTEESVQENSGEAKIYPNPFSANLRIEINLPKEKLLTCEIFDINGKQVKSLHKGISEGLQLLIWDGKDSRDEPVSSGIYFCRVNHSTTKIVYKKLY